ncbi:hypothetical protein N8I77_004417 [Diaporthe amygdali]|uniref:Uncharacterized protein n=1 Tax=Phomopsis amygdali TaxID=1214568 RepID=A0AAD9W6Z0_PHOAM|nr:hypothetical protein N8I77_004417 [Diaporthe amygdali]
MGRNGLFNIEVFWHLFYFATAAVAAYMDDPQDAYLYPKRGEYPARYLKVKSDIIKHSLDDQTAFPIVAVLEPGDEGWDGTSEITAFCIWYRESRAGKEGLPIHLSATPAVASLYHSLGFRSVGKRTWHPDQDSDWEIMRWDPPKDAHNSDT